MNTLPLPDVLGWCAVTVKMPHRKTAAVYAVFPSVRDAQEWGETHRHEFPDECVVEIVEIVEREGGPS